MFLHQKHDFQNISGNHEISIKSHCSGLYNLGRNSAALVRADSCDSQVGATSQIHRSRVLDGAGAVKRTAGAGFIHRLYKSTFQARSRGGIIDNVSAARNSSPRNMTPQRLCCSQQQLKRVTTQRLWLLLEGAEIPSFVFHSTTDAGEEYRAGADATERACTGAGAAAQTQLALARCTPPLALATFTRLEQALPTGTGAKLPKLALAPRTRSELAPQTRQHWRNVLRHWRWHCFHGGCWRQLLTQRMRALAHPP